MSNVRPNDLSPRIIARALKGEAVAFRQFYRHYDPTVRWAVGMRVYRWPALVPMFDDIVQEVWLWLVKSGDSLLRCYDKGGRRSFSRLLAVVCARKGWKLAKRDLRYREVMDQVEAPDTDNWDFVMRFMHEDFLRQLGARVRERLDEKDIGLFEGYYLRGERIKDVGARLGLKENASHQRNQRLQLKLTELAEELLGEPLVGAEASVVAGMLAALLVVGGGRDDSGEGLTGEAPGVGTTAELCVGGGR